MTFEPTPGFHDDVPEADYHAHPGSLSVSGAKTLLRSPAQFRHDQQHPVTKDTFDFGSAAHQLVLGTGPGIAIIPATSRSKADQEAHKAAKEKARTEGKIPLSAADHEIVKAMADRLSSHTLAMRLLSSGRPEVSGYAVDDETGVLQRCRFDWLSSPVLTDYKTCRSADPLDLTGRYGVVKKWGYDLQAAWYTDMARALGVEVEVFAFIFQQKHAPYDVTVAYVDDEDLADARSLIREALQRFRDCTTSGQWPGYTQDTEAVRLSLTDHYYEVETIA